MSFPELVPLLTGGGGCIVAMAIGYVLILTGKLVIGREHDRALVRIEKLETANAKHEEANGVLVASLQAEREQKAQLLSGSNLTNQLINALLGLTREQRAVVASGEIAGAGTAARPPENTGSA